MGELDVGGGDVVTGGVDVGGVDVGGVLVGGTGDVEVGGGVGVVEEPGVHCGAPSWVYPLPGGAPGSSGPPPPPDGVAEGSGLAGGTGPVDVPGVLLWHEVGDWLLSQGGSRKRLIPGGPLSELNVGPGPFDPVPEVAPLPPDDWLPRPKACALLPPPPAPPPEEPALAELVTVSRSLGTARVTPATSSIAAAAASAGRSQACAERGRPGCGRSRASALRGRSDSPLKITASSLPSTRIRVTSCPGR